MLSMATQIKWMCVAELSTGHFSWTRPGETLTRPDIADKKFDPPRPTARPPPLICFMSSTFKLPTGNNIQLLHDFEGNSHKCFSSGLLIFPKGEKKRSRVVLFFKTVVSMQQKDCKLSDISRVHLKFGVVHILYNAKKWVFAPTPLPL